MLVKNWLLLCSRRALVAKVSGCFRHQKTDHKNKGYPLKKIKLAGMNGQDPLMEVTRKDRCCCRGPGGARDECHCCRAATVVAQTAAAA